MFSLLILMLLFAVITESVNNKSEEDSFVVTVEDVSSELAVLEKEISVND